MSTWRLVTGSRMSAKTQKGFTLIELLITIGIVAILMSFAVPSFNDFYDKKRLVAAAEAIYGELQLARTEALSAAANLNIATSGGISVNFVRTNNTTWVLGTSVNTGCNTTLTTVPAADTACYIIKDDGDADNIVDGVDINLDASLNTATEQDTGDRVIKLLSSVDYPGANMTATPSFVGTSTGSEVTFSSTRGTTVDLRQGSISLQSNAGLQMQVTVGVLGQIGICSPSGANKVLGYPDC